jgi:hypothetical protein
MVPMEVADLRLTLKSRRTSHSELRTVIDIPNFCTDPPTYRPLSHNNWIAVW